MEMSNWSYLFLFIALLGIINVLIGGTANIKNMLKLELLATKTIKFIMIIFGLVSVMVIIYDNSSSLKMMGIIGVVTSILLFMVFKDRANILRAQKNR